MNPRSSDEQKNTFCESSKVYIFKDNIKTAHWVGHSQSKSLDIGDFFKRTLVVDDIQASVTGNKIEHSASGGGVIQF